MKKLFFTLLTGMLLMACNDTEDINANITAAPVATGQFTSIEWTEPAKNLGKINEGQELQIAYKFKNTGSQPLVIQSVEPGCGCTVAEYPKQPIAPGAEGVITGAFDSRGRTGLQYKEILVRANTENQQMHKLSFSVDVTPAKN